MRDFVRTPSGLFLPEAEAEAQIRRARKPRAVDMFCGIGGIALGFIQSGFEVVAGVENDVYAATTFMTNLCRWGELQIHFVTPEDRKRFEKGLAASWKGSGGPKLEAGFLKEDGKFSAKPAHVAGTGWIKNQPPSTPGVRHFFFGDVRQLTGAAMLAVLDMKRGELDAVAGGPPCQGFSTAGKRQVADPRNNLVFEFARLIVELNPKTMVMENVPGILDMMTPEGTPVVDKFCRILEDGGFGGYQAFQRAIAAQTGSVGLMRGKPVKKNRPAKAKRAAPPAEAMPLFADAFPAE